MPFLRFSRDKRGYETTSLVHAVRRQGRSGQRILYWFRTPPGVRVGRPALDEEAIRWIEEHNPDIEFDWQKILEARPPSAPPPADARPRRGRRDRPDRPVPAQARRAPAPAEAPPASPEDIERPDLEPAIAIEEPQLVEAIEQLARPDAEERVEPPAAPIDHAVGPEPLVRLRARYAELLARITERGGDADRIEALRGRAEALNPDAWVTDEETRRGLEEFEPKMRELRAALGLRRRRRSHRGGRKHSAAGPAENGPAPAADPEEGDG